MRSIFPFQGLRPRVDRSVLVAAGVRIIGDVRIGPRSSVWFNAVIRGDVRPIRIGQSTNIQDLCMVHVDHDKACTIGDEVVIGHHACVHACTVGDGALIGIGAIILSGARVGEGALVGAGCLVPEGARIPPRTLVMGIPARKVRKLTAAEVRSHRRQARSYVELAGQHNPAVAKRHLT